MSAPPPHIDTLPTELGEALRHFERAQAGKASLSDIILGGQDGLVNVLGVILGVAAASSDQRLVIAAGLAAAFAESISMGAVAYTSTLADRDHYLSQIEREKREIRDMPEVERAEIEVIFRRWGFEGDLLDQSVEQIMKDERAWVDVMMHNELKLSPIDGGTRHSQRVHRRLFGHRRIADSAAAVLLPPDRPQHPPLDRHHGADAVRRGRVQSQGHGGPSRQERRADGGHRHDLGNGGLSGRSIVQRAAHAVTPSSSPCDIRHFGQGD